MNGEDGHERASSTRTGLTPLGLAAAAVVVILGAAALLVPRETISQLPGLSKLAGTPCMAQTVNVLVEPELQPVVETILRPLRGTELLKGRCLDYTVRAEEAVATVSGADVLPLEQAPDVWIPDAIAWTEQIRRWPMRRGPAFANSPVVLATSTAAAEALGWTKNSPSWNDAMRGKRPVAVPDIQTEAESLGALIALWQTLGKGEAADQAVVNVVLAADRGEVPTAETAFATARSGTINSPVIPSTEQQVAASNRETGRVSLQAIYPREGSPILDYPVMEVTATPRTTALDHAVKLVFNRLNSMAAREVVRNAGFRDPDGGTPVGNGIRQGPVRPLASPGRAEIEGMLGRIEDLARPSRILAVVDVSLSMRVKLDDGISRIALAGAASRLGVDIFPDRSSVGAWMFAADMDGGKDYKELSPVMPLGAREPNGEPHRQRLQHLATTIDQYLTGGGTALYNVVRAASRYMHQSYDPQAINSIIIMTDGADENQGISLDALLAELRRANSGPRKVGVYLVGLGPDADYDAMRKISEATGGHSYRIDNAVEGQTALLDGLRRARQLGS